jgi:hypothetical protein
VATAACSSDESSSDATAKTDAVHLAGDYTVTLVNFANSCPQDPNDPWMAGTTMDDVAFSITQNGNSIRGETMGGVAFAFLLKTGSPNFTGEVHGSHFVLENHGTAPNQSEGCNYTLNVTIEGDLYEDAIVGTVTYKPIVEPTDACADYDCEVDQTFEGGRTVVEN